MASKSMKVQFEEFCSLYTRSHPNLSKESARNEAITKWKEIKTSKHSLDKEKYDKAVAEMKSKLISRKKTMFDFVLQPPKAPVRKPSSTVTSSSTSDDSIPKQDQRPGLIRGDSKESESTLHGPIDVDTQGDATEESVTTVCEGGGDQSQSDIEEVDVSGEGEGEEQQDDISIRQYDAPAQAKLKAELSLINERLSNLNEARNLGIGEELTTNLTKQINEFTLKKHKTESKLRYLQSAMKANKKLRDKKKRALAQAVKDFPNLDTSLKVRDSTGRPPLEETYGNLHQVILSIATIGAAASDRRREDLFRSVKTLDQLHSALDDMGFKLSRSALYTRLLPKSANSAEGKRHVRTVPVR